MFCAYSRKIYFETNCLKRFFEMLFAGTGSYAIIPREIIGIYFINFVSKHSYVLTHIPFTNNPKFEDLYGITTKFNFSYLSVSLYYTEYVITVFVHIYLIPAILKCIYHQKSLLSVTEQYIKYRSNICSNIFNIP